MHKYELLSTSVSPDDREERVLERWKEKNIFRRSVDERDAGNIFSFYEGPPTVNGTPGIHHVFSRAIKDAICRYKTMCGFRVERKAGWDTHGLPVEIAIEKELGFRHKQEIVEYGVDKFNEKCKELVYSNIERDAGWRELTERMGYWVNMDDPYITCTNDYIESVWWAIKKFHDKKLINNEFKVQPYCHRCGTPLSSHELSLGYRMAKDPSVFIKFKRKNVPDDEYFLAWTTTPWTLISNVALAINPKVEYVTVKNTRKDRAPERLVLAKALLDKLEGDVEIIDTYLGASLYRQEYERLFDYEPVGSPAFYIILGEHVTTADGTGIVHTAPLFGEDDFRVSEMYSLPLLGFNLVDFKTVTFTGKVPEFVGQFVKDADPGIIENLKSRGLLYRKETIEHTYPFCWRCDSPLIYLARRSWFIRVNEYKQELIDENKKINWQPPEIRDGRFGNWLEELKDWNLSRERFWGTPLPIWTGTIGTNRAKLCIGSYKEFLKTEFDITVDYTIIDIEENSVENVQNVKSMAFRAYFEVSKGKFEPITLDFLKSFDPHKPIVDNIIFRDEKGNELHRTPEVIDVWFDSGSMPFAQHHFMGETAKPKNYPADYISEGVDQTRGWFYTLHAINTFLFGEAPYKNVIVNDMLLDKQGQKMSKSKGNIVNPFDVMTKHGADATRWYLLSAAVPWKPRAFNADDLAELERKLFGTLTNTYGFFALYANIDGYSYNSEKIVPEKKRAEVDRWILSKLNSLVKECRENLDAYELTRPARAIQEFVIEQLSNWYIRRNRRRFWKGEQGEDKQAAYDTLYQCLLTVSKLMAPLAPFFADWMYQALAGTSDSIHLDQYPVANEALIDASLEKRMESAQVASSLVRQMRERAKLRVRQPLERILIPVNNRSEREELRKVEDVIRDEVNVKNVVYVESGDSDVIKLKAKANFKSLGARLGKQMKQVAARVQILTQDEIREYQAKSGLPLVIDGAEVLLELGDVDIIAEDVEGWLVSSDRGLTVALDTHLTPELLSEGIAREFVNRVQNLRKDSGFDVTDRIGIYVSSESAEILDAVRIHTPFIAIETLAETISTDGGAPGEAASAEVDILDRPATIWLARVR